MQLGGERWGYEALSRSLQESGNISKFLIRTSGHEENEPASSKLTQAQREWSYQGDKIQVVQEFQGDLADLVQYGWRIRGLGEQIGLSSEERKKIDDIVSEAQDLSNNASQARTAYEKKFNEVFHSSSVDVSKVTLDQVQELWPAVNAYYAAGAVGQKYLSVKNRLTLQP